MIIKRWPLASTPLCRQVTKSGWSTRSAVCRSVRWTGSISSSYSPLDSAPPPASPVHRGEAAADGQGVGVFGAQDPLVMGSRVAYWSRAAAALPASRSSGRGCRGPPGCRGARGRAPARAWAAARCTGRGPRPHPPPARSNGRGCRGWSGCSGVRGQGPARGGAAAWRTGHGPRPHPPLSRSSARGCHGWSGYPGVRGQGPARGEATMWRTGHGPRPHPPHSRSSRRGWRGRSGYRVSGPEHPLFDGQQRCVLVTGPGRIPRLPDRGGEVVTGVQGVECSAPSTRSKMGSSAAYWSRAPTASPAFPVQPAKAPRAITVIGCSGPASAQRWAAALRTGHGPRPHPPPPRSSGPGLRG